MPSIKKKAALAGGSLFEVLAPSHSPNRAARQQPAPAPAPAPSDCQQIYAGRTLIGEITREPDEFLATDGRGKRIGFYATRSAAIGAILEHARGAK